VLVLHRNPLAQIDVYIWLAILAVLIALQAVNGGSVLGLIIFILLVLAVETWAQVYIKITLTPDQVRVPNSVRSRGPGGSTPPAAPRAAIASIHMYNYFYFLSFHNAAGRPVLRTGPFWTKGQLLELSGQLGVPLFRHKSRWHGLGSPVIEGTLVTRGHWRG
jgi:hypothetical protein